LRRTRVCGLSVQLQLPANGFSRSPRCIQPILISSQLDSHCRGALGRVSIPSYHHTFAGERGDGYNIYLFDRVTSKREARSAARADAVASNGDGAGMERGGRPFWRCTRSPREADNFRFAYIRTCFSGLVWLEPCWYSIKTTW